MWRKNMFTSFKAKRRSLRRITFPRRPIPLRTKFLLAYVQVRFQSAILERSQIRGEIIVGTVYLRAVNEMVGKDHLKIIYPT